jgi:hypothetical protein
VDLTVEWPDGTVTEMEDVAVDRVIEIVRSDDPPPPPGTGTIQLAGARPNPGQGSLQVAFTLLNGAPARLALHDLNGRMLRSVEVGGMGPGTHQYDLGAGLDLESGIYFIRLTQGADERSRKAAFLRTP